MRPSRKYSITMTQGAVFSSSCLSVPGGNRKSVEMSCVATRLPELSGFGDIGN